MARYRSAALAVSVAFVLQASCICQTSNPLPACKSSDSLLTTLSADFNPQNVGDFIIAANWFKRETKADVNDPDQKAKTSKTGAANTASAAENRTDQQTTAPAGASGSTSVASKGSVPWLLGLAEEYGGLTESTSGSVSTFKGNVTNIVKAVNKKNFQASYDAWPDHQMLAALEKASFSIGFNTGTSGSSTSTSPNPSGFNSATAHIDLYNHRDPRYSQWQYEWKNKVIDGPNVPEAGQNFDYELRTKHAEVYKQWQIDENKTLIELATYMNSTENKADAKSAMETSDLQKAADEFNNSICPLISSDPVLKDLATKLSDAYAHYAKSKQAVVDEINNSPVFSFEYTFTNQGSVQLPKSTTQTYAIGTTAPNLSNFNFIYQRSLSKTKSDLQLTANASATLYTGASSQLKLTPVRDFKLTTELDIPVPALAGFAKSTVSLSVLYQDLLQEPLGQQVTVNSVAVTNTGNIILGQAKWTFAAGTSGISFPVSFTGSNRTTLIKETDMKGTVGISYNLDNLFAQKSQ
jgi:hypothetical protein